MATTTKRRASTARGNGTKGGAPRAAAKTAKRAVKPKKAPAPSGVAKLAARKTLKLLARKAARSGAQAIRALTDRAAGTGKEVVEAGWSRRLPIQVSIDVAVPLLVAWEEWMTFEWVTEGVHRIEDVEREGDQLFGRTAGPRARDWTAEIVDEREHESFAWRSVEGSDCAGLATFHQLSERLTRIELDLDVVPRTPREALEFSTHLAHHHARADLRRFKATVEFINPDVYEQELNQNGDAPDDADTE